MEIIVEVDNSVIILKPIGRLDASNVKSLHAQAAKLLEKSYIHILLDLTRVELIDSMGLGACIGLYKTLNSKGGALVCAGANEQVRAIFRLTRADEKITLADSRFEALKMLQDKAMLKSAAI